MQLLTVCRAVSPAILLALLVGCGGHGEDSAAGRPGASGMEELPRLGDPVGPLDRNRIEVMPPEGWYVPLRDNRWIVRFTPSEAESYPSILITAEDYQQIADVSKQNVDEFSRQVVAALTNDDSLAKQSMSVVPVEVGHFVGVAYSRRGKARQRFKTIVVERLILETVVGGRKYRIELRTREGDLERHRLYALAVAGGIKFIGGETAGSPVEETTEDANGGDEPDAADDAAEGRR